MNDSERKLLKEEQSDLEPMIDYTFEYSDEFYEEYIEHFHQSKSSKALYYFLKRLFDIVFSFIALTVLAIPFLIIAIFIKAESKGPAIFKNKRIGKDGKPFDCWKFRSMKIDAPAEVAKSIGGVDPYITKVGLFLRRTSIDELPQLFNVLTGKMSLIGYRPLVLAEKNCNEMRERLGVLKTRPGISGYAQVRGRDDVYYKNKAILDAYYVKHANTLMDFKLFFCSIAIVLSRKHNKDDNK